ncbi:MAG: hypothetical protein QXK06_05130 [Candidatus Diapherotrites archaeon]
MVKTKTIIAIAFLLLLPLAAAGLQTIPNCTCTGNPSCYTPYLVKTEYKCGDCTTNWTDECRTLYKIDYFSNCTKNTSIAQYKPQTDYVYCYNGRFESINWKTSYECRGNTSYRIEKAQLPASFKWGYEHAFPENCAYGCNQATGKCNPAPAPQYQWQCQGNYRIKIDLSCGNIIQKEYCQYGCDPNTTQCKPKPQPQYQWQCQGNYRIKIDLSCGNIIQKEYCQYGCASGNCNPAPKPPVKTCTPKSETFCDPAQPGKVFIKFTYKDCSEASFLYQTCGSCQTCKNGQCVGKSTGFEVKTTPAKTIQPESTPASQHKPTTISQYRATTKPTVVPPVVSSNYGSLYSPSSKWVCSGSWKVPVDVYGSKIWGYAEYCDNGCTNGSCNPGRKECTYNSDCPQGYYCARLSSGNYCKLK